MESKSIFQSALAICVGDQCQHTHVFQKGSYMLNKVPPGCCWLFFFPVAAFHLIIILKKTPTNQIFHILKARSVDTCKMVKIPVPGSGISFSRGEDVVQAGSGFGHIGEGKDSSSNSHFTFLCSQGLLAALVGIWEVQGNRLGPKTRQIVYYLQLQKRSSGSHQNSQHQGQATYHL